MVNKKKDAREHKDTREIDCNGNKKHISYNCVKSTTSVMVKETEKHQSIFLQYCNETFNTWDTMKIIPLDTWCSSLKCNEFKVEVRW